jgi:hypothetical protein
LTAPSPARPTSASAPLSSRAVAPAGRHSFEHGLRFSLEADVGDAGQLDPGEQQILVAEVIALEGGVGAMGRVSIEFDREATLGPVDIELEPGLDEIGRRPRQPRLQDRCEEAPLELRAGEGDGCIEGNRAAQPAPAGVSPAAPEQLLDRRQIEQLQLLTALEHALQAREAVFPSAVEHRARQRGDWDVLFHGSILQGQDPRVVKSDWRSRLAR